MSKGLFLKGGRVIDPHSSIDGDYDVAIKGGKIESVNKAGGKAPSGYDIVDCKGLVVTPGLIDIHTHLREPGFEYKETVASGGRAAVRGGFTTVLCMANTNPVNDNGTVTRYIVKKAEESPANILPIGAASVGLKGEKLTEMGELKEAGCAAISDDGITIMDGGLMRRAMEYATSLGMKVIVHAEDYDIACGGVMNESVMSTKLGLKGIPNAAEDSIIARDIQLAELTGGKLHVAHVSTKGAVELIRAAKKKGLDVTAEVTPHHLLLTDEVLGEYSTDAKMSPPLRQSQDCKALREALLDGTIDTIATDHAPHGVIDKDVEFDIAANGIVGLETALPLVLGLVKEKILTLECAVRALTINPATAVGLKNKGSLSVGADGDVTIIDLKKKWTIDAAEFVSKGKNTPFGGWKVEGMAIKTIVGGKVVYEAK